MIQFHDISVANNPRNILITGLTQSHAQGTLTALIGRNGCGKSTLLRVLAGLQRPISGNISLGGLNPHKCGSADLAHTVAVVATGRTDVRRLTCMEMVGIGRSPHTGLFGRLNQRDREIVEQAIKAVGMQDFRDREVVTLSDGEARRIMIARALAQDTPIILLDEPTSFLDVPGRYDICELLATLAHERNKTILYSTHELEPAMQYANQIMLISGGEAVTLPPEEMRLTAAFRDLTGGRTLAL